MTNKSYACPEEDPVAIIFPGVENVLLIPAGENIVFSSYSYDPDDGAEPGDGITNYMWTVYNFIDNYYYIVEEAEGEDTCEISFPAGIYWIYLQVWDNDGSTDYTDDYLLEDYPYHCAHALVVEAELDIDGVSDEFEEDPGGFIAVNGDRKFLNLDIEPLEYLYDHVSLSVTEGSDKAKIYTTPTGGSPHISFAWDLDSWDDFYELEYFCGNGLYIQGIETSSNLQDVEITLTYSDEYYNTVDFDIVTATVVEMNKIVDWYNYTDEGPLYVPVGGSKDLFAFSNPYNEPYYVYFPSYYPEWSIDQASIPPGATPFLELFDSECCTGGSWQDSATLYGLTVPGNYEVIATCDSSDDISVVAVQLTNLTVTNATQTNVTGSKNWAAVKAVDEYVIVEAILNPSIPNDDVPKVLSWSGGSAVQGNNRQRKVSKSSSAHTTVTATVGSSSDHVDIWILWAEIEIKMTGQTPPNAVQFGTVAYDKTENLGAISYDNGKKAVGKVIPIGKITPAGVQDVVKTGWKFYRKRWVHCFRDGVVWTDPQNRRWNTDWVVDTSSAWFQKLNPDEFDQIYDNDAPSVGYIVDTQDSIEVYDNFYQWITWNDEVVSVNTYWYWKGRWKDNESPEITLKEVGQGSIDLPDQDEAYYDPP